MCPKIQDAGKFQSGFIFSFFLILLENNTHITALLPYLHLNALPYLSYIIRHLLCPAPLDVQNMLSL